MIVFKIIKNFSKGFTLIELLVTIAVVGVLSAAILVAINPADKIKQANDSKVQADVAAIATAANTFATGNGGGFSLTAAELVPNDLAIIPTAPTGAGYSAYVYVAETSAGAACTTALKNCARVRVSGNLTAGKYLTPPAPGVSTPFFLYCSTTAVAAAKAGIAQTNCP